MEISNGTRRASRQRLPRFRDGFCTAAVRALTAAGLIIDGKAPTLRAAALRCGSNVHYTGAAVVVLRSGNTSLITAVTKGRLSILAAAREAQRLSSCTAHQDPLDDAGIEQLVRDLGPARVLNALDRITRPTAVAAV